MIYTSGSAGKPKSVQIEHCQAAHFVQAEKHVFSVAPGDRVYRGFSLAFDASVEELWLVQCPRTLPDIDPAVSMHFCRITQESISNAVRHGRASRVDICVTGTWQPDGSR